MKLRLRSPARKPLQAEQFDELGLVETDYGLSVDDGYRRALKALIEQLFERGLIGANIFFHELDAFLR